MTLDSLPQARIVRQAGRLMVPPRLPRNESSGTSYLRVAATYVLGLWPLTCVVMLLVGLLVLTVNLHAP